MQGLILAGGEGSRLAGDGVAAPKPLAAPGGEPQLQALARTLRSVGCGQITAMVRDRFLAQVEASLSPESGVRVVGCHTPSSLHTLVLGLATLPAGPVLCTMVDTVMRPDDWQRLAQGLRQRLDQGDTLVLAVTPYVDDESPLWVTRDDQGMVLRLGAEPVSPPCVTGGVYALSPTAREWASQALGAGWSRMRAYLGSVVERGGRVGTVEVARIFDLDRRQDLEAARAWLEAAGPSGGVR